jgi:hypothetical protein
LYSCRSSSPDLDPHLHLRLLLHLQQVHLQLKLRLQLKRHLQLKLRLLRSAAKEQVRGLFPGGRGYISKRSSESRQICDHVSMVSRRASNSFFARNVSPVIIASRFSSFGSASLKT